MQKSMALKLSARLVVFAVALTAACGDDDGVLGVTVPGGDARIVLAHVQAAGGHVSRDTITIDSATARYDVVTCTGDVYGNACDNAQSRSSGDVLPAILERLFSTARSGEFRNLHSSYRRADKDIIPPDGSWTSLIVTVGERTKSIQWERDAILPELLLRYQCWIQVARGALIECSE